jgi:carboxypeptidase family protein
MTSPFVGTMAVGTAAVSGVVSDAISHVPLAGVVVTITDRATNPTSSLRVFTDSKGRFVFRQLPASSQYDLTTATPGYFDGRLGSKPGDSGPSNLVLTDGQWLRDAAIEMWRPGAISGTVLDERGEPAVAVFVRAFREVRISGHAYYARGPFVRTDDRGAYRISDLQPGRYLVSVPSVQMSVPIATPATTLGRLSQSAIAAYEAGSGVPPYADPGLNVDATSRLVLGQYLTPPPAIGGRVLAYPPAFYPGAPSTRGASAVELLPGTDRNGIDIVLQPQPAGRISGVVQAPSGEAPRYTLRLLALGNEGLGRGGETATALVGDGGRFVFLNVPSGEYVIEATGSLTELTTSGSRALSVVPPGLRSTSGSGITITAGSPDLGLNSDDNAAGGRYFGRLNVTSTGRDIVDLVVPLRPSVAMSGRYIYDGQTPPPTNGPLFMKPEPANGDPTLGAPGNTLLGSQSGNQFRFEGLLPGDYILRSPGSATNPWNVKSVIWNGRDYTNMPFNAALGRDFEDIIVTFTDQTTTVAGVVRDTPGTTLTAAAIIAFPIEKALWSNYGLRPDRIKTTRVTSAQNYRLTRLPAGEYFVIAVADNQELRWQDPAFLEAASRSAQRLSIAWGDTKTMDLTLAVVR